MTVVGWLCVAENNNPLPLRCIQNLRCCRDDKANNGLAALSDGSTDRWRPDTDDCGWVSLIEDLLGIETRASNRNSVLMVVSVGIPMWLTTHLSSRL